MNWLHEVRKIFPKLNKKIILTDYKKMSGKSLGYVRTRIEQKFNFDPEALILGTNKKIRKTRTKPKEFYIFINSKLEKIENPELRKQIIQFIMIHELLHVEREDLITLSKQYSKRKKKKVHVNKFENEVLDRYNELRELKDIPRIKEKKHLDVAISKILESINFYGKN